MADTPTITPVEKPRQLGAPIVEIKNLAKAFHGIEVLKDISLTVRQGEVIVIAGRSGSGKSTLLRCIDHLETIDGGSIVACEHLIGFRKGPGGKLVPLSDKQIASGCPKKATPIRRSFRVGNSNVSQSRGLWP